MPLNFGLLQPVNIGARFAAGQEEVQRNQLAQEQKAQDQELNALRVQQLHGTLSEQERKMRAETAAQKTAIFRERLLRAPNPNAVRELVKMQHADPDIGPILSQTGTLEQALAEVPDDPAQFERYRQQEAMGMTEWMKSQQPKVVGNAVFNPATNTFSTPPERPVVPKEITPPASVLEFERAKTDPAFMNFLRERAAANRAPTAAKATNGGTAGGAPVPKPMTSVQSAARRDKLGKEFKLVQNALQTTQDVIDSIAFVKDEPGLSRATGFTGTLLPSFPEGAAASAETRLKNLEGKVTALGKAQASATGAIGSIATQEWQVLRDQIAAIDRTKGTGPLLSQLELVEAQARGAMERMKDAYQRQFGEDFEQFPQFADMPAPKSTFKPKTPAANNNIDALLEKYK